MINKNNCPTKLIEDEPVLKDNLGGAHEKIAHAITQLIQSEQGGRAIGLEGEWGSGKSTIIRLLKDKLEKEESNVVFIFDAWTNQGNPIRRSFLELLIDYLREKKWITDNAWKNFFNSDWKSTLEDDWYEILGKKVKSSTENKAKITWLQIIILIFSIFVPIGIAQMTGSFENDGTLNAFNGFDFNVELFIGIILTLLPMLAFILIFVVLQLINFLILIYEKLSHKEVNLRKKIKSINWSVINLKNDTSLSSVTIKSPDPTSIEFESFFTKLVSVILNKNHKITIVVDNLDRINAKQGIEILSTIQTMLHCPSKIPEATLKKIWVVIPYDPTGLSKIWGEGKTNTFNKTQVNEKNLNDQNIEEILKFQKNETEILKSMVDKRFQIRFFVPPIVMSNWRDYFTEVLLPKAFDSKRHGDDFYDIYKIFDFTISRSQKYQTPTPREMILFINEVGAIHRQWNDYFPLSDIAYYIGLLRGNIDIPLALLSKIIPEEKVISYLSEDISQNIAAMWFNSERNLGQQLLLEPLLKKAIEINDIKSIQNYAAEYSKSFWAVFEKLPFYIWAKYDHIVFSRALNCINSGHLFQHGITKSISSFKKQLLKCLRLNSPWTPFVQDNWDGIIAVFHLFPEENEILQKIFKGIIDNNISSKTVSKKVAEVSEKIISEFSSIAQNKVKGLNYIFHSIEDLSIFKEITSKQYTYEVNPLENIEFFCEFSIDHKQIISKILIPKIDTQLLTITINSMIDEGLFQEKHINSLPIIKQQISGFNFEKILANLLKLFEKDNKADILKIFKTIWKIEFEIQHSNKYIEKIANSSVLFDRLFFRSQAKDYETMAWCIFLVIFVSPTQKSYYAGAGNNGHKIMDQHLIHPQEPSIDPLMKSLLEIIVSTKSFIKVLNFYKTNKQYKPFVHVVFQEILNRNDVKNQISSNIIINYWKELSETLSIENVNILVELFSNDTKFMTQFKKNFASSSTELYTRVFKYLDTKKQKSFIKWLEINFNGYDPDFWYSQFFLLPQLFLLIQEINSNGYLLELGSNFIEAVKLLSLEINQGNKNPNIPPDLWKHIISNNVSQSMKNVLSTNILNSLKVAINDKKSISKIFYDYFGFLLLNNVDNFQIPTLYNVCFIPILERRELAGINWLIEIAQSDKGFFSKDSQDDESKIFFGKIQTILDDPRNDEFFKQAKFFNKLLENNY